MIRLFKKIPFLLPGLFVVLGGLSLNGCFETEVAGTSTTTGNTISARALLSDGTPAAGATVSLRQSGFVPSGVPGYRAGLFSKDTTADSNGYFAIRVPTGLRYFLSVYAGGVVREGYWRDGLTPTSALAKSAGLNDTLRLQKTGALVGHVLAGAMDSIWLGFPGTSHFTRLQGDGSFLLDSLPPGNHDLRILRSNAGSVQSVDVNGWAMLSGASMTLDTLVLPTDTATHILSTPACLEMVDSLVFASIPGLSRSDRVFRSILLSSPPEWVELDACLGQWSRKGISLPPDLGNFELFAGAASDYLIQTDSSHILKLDSAGIHILPTFPVNLALANFGGGRFYSFHHLETAVRSFPDEAAWLGNLSDGSFPKPLAIQRFTVNDSAIQYLTADSSGLALSRYDFNSGTSHSSVPISGFAGNCTGMAAGSVEEVWLLNDAGELFRVAGFTGQVLLKARVAAPNSLRGLAGGE